ncbi:MAG TPA: WG repeat-containing protein [Pyrinomonadaceae bacterium]|nr:WG repeat-containing protein [Pyrinomonadaceae bacterium]
MFHEGQQFGEYTLVEKLGRGGFGEVWLADTEEDWFAIKLPHKDQVDWKSITQEIGLWTLCGKHPNVMPLVGARNFNGQIAIISEYAPDGSLEDLLRKKGKLSTEEAVEITIGILEGLQHLHESGIIHRDLKPANILLDSKTPRLTDFGISRIISADSLSETVSGTFAYMAPECFDGKRNIQTDIWSVGVILYRMLTGNLPFPRKEQTALVGSIIMSEPESLPFEISSVIRKIVSDLLSKNPDKRPSLSSICFDLEKYIDDTVGFLSRIQQRAEILQAREEITQTRVLIPYRKGDKWGFCDASKNIVIEPKYENAEVFVESLARVELNGKYGFIDKIGNEIVYPKYDFADSFKENLAKVGKTESILDKVSNDEQIIKNGIESASHWIESGFRTFKEFANKMLEDLGEDIIPYLKQLYRTIYYYPDNDNSEMDNLSEIEEIELEWLEEIDFEVYRVRWGFINTTGDEIVSLIYDHVKSFSEGVALVIKDSKYIFIDKNGDRVFGKDFSYADSFNEGLAIVEDGDKFGFIDKKGNYVIKPIFDGGTSFNDGFAQVTLNKKSFFINRKGEKILEVNFEYSDIISENLLAINQDGKSGFADLEGKIVIPCIYDEVGKFNEGLALVAYEENYGFIDSLGKIRIPLKYPRYGQRFLFPFMEFSNSYFRNGLFLVEVDKKSFYIDKSGTEYFED